MKVRCLANQATSEQVKTHEVQRAAECKYNVTPGRESFEPTIIGSEIPWPDLKISMRGNSKPLDLQLQPHLAALS